MTASIATQLNLDVAYSEGKRAYATDLSRTPMLSAAIREMVGDAPVGSGAEDLFRAFQKGWEDALDAEVEAAFAN